jgi:putative heme-binding domain-containing protein
MLSKGVFELAMAASQNLSDSAERLAALELLSASQLSTPQLFTVFDLAEKGTLPLDPLLPALLRSTSVETESKLGSFFSARLSAGWSPPLATLEQVLLACDLPRRQELRTLWEKNRTEMLSRLRDLRPLLSNGDPVRGRKAFEAAGCLNCHRAGNQGGLAGPDLTLIGAIRTGGDLLESIVYPSSSFAQGYEPYLVTKQDGEEIFGTLADNQPDGARIRELSGAIRFIPAREVESIVRKELSVMPEGLDKQLSREQFRDLLAYLQNLR